MNVRRQATAGMTWLRGRARYEAGHIVLDPRSLEEYQPFANRRIEFPFELAAIRTPDDAVQFARRFGLLRDHDSQHQAEPWQEWERQSRVMQLVLSLYRNLRDAVRGDAIALVHIREFMATEEARSQFQVPAANDEQALTQGSLLISRIITERMDRVRLGIQSEVGLTMPDGRRGEPGGFALSPRPPDLLGLIYYVLALFISRAEPARMCEGCGRIFPVADPRQRYHDNRCAQRTRYRRWVDKRREQG